LRPVMCDYGLAISADRLCGICTDYFRVRRSLSVKF
jgi:hypothetical protein